MRRCYYKLQFFFIVFGIASICFLLWLASRSGDHPQKALIKDIRMATKLRRSRGSEHSNEIYINVTVFYETFCPACKNFITKQLYPTYKYLNGKHINLDLVPFGWAKVQQINPSAHNISCQHGEKECYGNRLHACALSLYRLDMSLNFINCTLSYGNPVADNVIGECTKKANISADKLQECERTIGNSLLVENGRKSYFQHKYMPAITFNGRFDESIQSQVWHDFYSTVRRYFPPETSTTVTSNSNPKSVNYSHGNQMKVSIVVCISVLSGIFL